MNNNHFLVRLGHDTYSATWKKRKKKRQKKKKKKKKKKKLHYHVILNVWNKIKSQFFFLSKIKSQLWNIMIQNMKYKFNYTCHQVIVRDKN